jgi:hypothetical protein
LRQQIVGCSPSAEIAACWAQDEQSFRARRRSVLLYD